MLPGALVGPSVRSLRWHVAHWTPLVVAGSRSPRPAPRSWPQRRAQSSTVPARSATPQAESAAVMDLYQAFASGRLSPQYGRTADTVWNLYRKVASVGSALAKVDPGALEEVARFLSEAALEKQKRLKDAPKGDRIRERDVAAQELDLAAGRLKQLVEDASRAGVAVSPKIVTRFLKAVEPSLTTYQRCWDAATFLDDLGIELNAYHLASLLHVVAQSGNYTAFLALLHELGADEGRIVPDAPLVNLFLGAITQGRPGRAENLEDYPTGPSFVADLRIPKWIWMLDRGRYGDVKLGDGEKLPIEDAKDPAEALSAYLEEAPTLSIADLCAPPTELGSVTSVEKALQLLRLVLASHQNGNAEVLTSYVLTSFVEVFLRGLHPRLAGATVKLLAEEPYNVRPTNAMFLLLIDDAGKRGDAAVLTSLLDFVAELGVEQDIQLVTATMAAFARMGKTREAAALWRSLPRLNLVPNAMTISAYIDIRFGPAAGQVPDPIGFLDELRYLGYSLTVHNYTKLLAFFAKRGDVRAADAIWNHMLDAGVEPDGVALAAVLNVYSKLPQVGRMMEIAGSVPKEALSSSSVWAFMVQGLVRTHKTLRIPASARAAEALCEAVVRGRTLSASDLPEQYRAMPLVGIAPPLPDTVFFVAVHMFLRTVPAGNAMLLGALRAFLVGSGVSAAKDASLNELHDLLVVDTRRTRKRRDRERS
ncbi:hypothetical protein DFJ74DRAFT_664056 [Hyaloraphidium curvatum]|nr:hypothetical protein DFJ74DRAFT_664056 [Hyaloraphidium curvatum]